MIRLMLAETGSVERTDAVLESARFRDAHSLEISLLWCVCVCALCLLCVCVCVRARVRACVCVCFLSLAYTRTVMKAYLHACMRAGKYAMHAWLAHPVTVCRPWILVMCSGVCVCVCVCVCACACVRECVRIVGICSG